MLFLKGKGTLRIKTYADHQHKCPDCGMYDLQVKVYKAYFHIFFIPLFPTDVKSSKIACNNCKQPIRIDSLQKYYESITRLPFYLYSGLLLIVALFASVFVVSEWSSYKQSEFTKHPQVGDVFELKNIDDTKFTAYYFLKVHTINNDSIKCYRNNLLYLDVVSQLDSNDFFNKSDTVVVSKKWLQNMHNKENVALVERHYDTSSGFYKLVKQDND